MASSDRPGLDPYIVNTLMRDLAGHDQRPSAFLVYLWLWHRTADDPSAGVRLSHQRIADATGLSRSTVQHALEHLAGRQLLTTRRGSPTAVPLHIVLRPWARRNPRA
ncbi:MAG: helix-turn-helix domain-containing protein [Phycisphaerales bacterium]|nr:helix-turn-helix domain-containing protein [Phycisphaerales bacterium]